MLPIEVDIGNGVRGGSPDSPDKDIQLILSGVVQSVETVTSAAERLRADTSPPDCLSGHYKASLPVYKDALNKSGVSRAMLEHSGGLIPRDGTSYTRYLLSSCSVRKADQYEGNTNRFTAAILSERDAQDISLCQSHSMV